VAELIPCLRRIPLTAPASASFRTQDPKNNWGHPLAGWSSRHRLSRGEEFSFLPLLSNSSTFDRLNHAPLFSVGRCRTFGPHQSPIRFKALGEVSLENIFPPLANVVAPENCRYHAVSKVHWITDPMAHPFQASNPIVAHGVGVPSDQIIAELSIVRDGAAANQISWL
jgi:hypothetical protein